MSGMKMVSLIDAEIRRCRCDTEAAALELRMTLEDEIDKLRALVAHLEADVDRLDPRADVSPAYPLLTHSGRRPYRYGAANDGRALPQLPQPEES